MSNPAISLPRPLVNQLLHYAQASPEAEVCGLVGGRAGFPETFYPVKNAAPNPESRYVLDPEQHGRALRKIQESGEDLLAVFLSHPAAPAEPAAGDIEVATHPDTLYLILSLNTKGVLELRGFRIGEKQCVGEVELLLDPD